MKKSITLHPAFTFFISLNLLCFFFSCQQHTINALTEKEAIILMEQYMETMNNADLELIDEIIAPEIVIHSPFFPEPIEGIENYKSLVINTSNTFSDFKVTIEEVTVKGENVWCRFSMEGINTGPLGDLPATGKKFHVKGLAITKVVDGMITEDNVIWNVWEFYQQLGFTLIPPANQDN